MSKQHDTYNVILYSKLRRGLAITLRLAQRKSKIHGLFEVYITKAHEYLREHEATYATRSHT
jgi:hypothetical protein